MVQKVYMPQPVPFLFSLSEVYSSLITCLVTGCRSLVTIK